MYGCILTPPVSEGAQLGVLFLHNEGYSSMCGHGIIALATVVLQTGMLPMSSPTTTLDIDTPAGLVTALVRTVEGTVQGVRFRNVPAFAVALDETVDVPGVGAVPYDLAFGGAYYAYVNASDVGITCDPKDVQAQIEKGMAIKRAVMAAREIVHPVEGDLGFLYGVVFIGDAVGADAHSRNVCIFADGQVDRSPTGTSVSARLAIHRARGEIDVGEEWVFESIIGSRFTGKVIEDTRFGPHAAIVPEVGGRAFITGMHRFCVDPRDDLGHGFILRAQ
jgi:trans-L-3-hydroxyproline dehydratase